MSIPNPEFHHPDLVEHMHTPNDAGNRPQETRFDDYDSPKIAGDPRDDDARIIDSLVADHSVPPSPKEDQRPTEIRKPKTTTRMVVGSLNIVKATWDRPALLVPEDPTRKQLHVTITGGSGAVATDVVQIAGEQNRAQQSDCPAIPASAGGFDLLHSGAVWVFAPQSNTAANMLVSWLAVCEQN